MGSCNGHTSNISFILHPTPSPPQPANHSHSYMQIIRIWKCYIVVLVTISLFMLYWYYSRLTMLGTSPLIPDFLNAWKKQPTSDL